MRNTSQMTKLVEQ